jgi:hypothetical protein
MKLKCKLGLHNWKILKRSALGEPGIRQCIHCYKTQREFVHCLGMNPPEYVRNWHTIGKLRVREDSNGLQHLRQEF